VSAATAINAARHFNPAGVLDFAGSEWFDETVDVDLNAQGPSMLRVAAIVLIAVAAHDVAMAQEAKPDTVEVHGKALMLSCAEWTRNQDHSWTNVGPLTVGDETVKQVTLRGAKETKTLEAKCGDTQEPIPPAAKSAEHARHARRGRHDPASSD
jgi:hypothetical protein